MYLGLKVRTTEKIAKGRNITILKHTPCTVIGWDLHLGDRVRETGSERLLNYLPNIIYIKFSNVTWQIHPKLAQGVYPLKPVSHVWELNRTTKAKVSRKGFTLVPNFACTGFMTQGEALQAELADCGDIDALPGLTEMITTYVILSRVRKADSLLLMRAFSPYLFRVGSSPGPHCLMKLLRHRFSGTAQVNQTKAADENSKSDKRPYGPTQAIEEYKQLEAQWQSHRKLQKTRGMEWKCFQCEKLFPIGGYGDSTQGTAKNDLQKWCITQGYWRRCVACMQIPIEGSTEKQICERCKYPRHIKTFSNDNICSSCKLQEAFDVDMCKTCGKIKTKSDLRENVPNSGNYRCSGCSPDLWPFECTVCHDVTPANNFRDFREGTSKLEKKTIRRCKTCETCIGCNTHFEDFSKFETNTRYCHTCYKKYAATKMCKVCKTFKTAQEFPYNQLHDAGNTQQNYFLRCTECHVCKTCHKEKDIGAFDGGSASCQKCVNDICITFQCAICDKLLPRKDFPDSQLHHHGDDKRNKFMRCISCHTCAECHKQKDIHGFHEDSSVCMQCRKSRQQWTCNACQKMLAEGAFDANILENARKHKRMLVCKECQSNGVSPKDINPYRCDECGDRGHLKFPYEARRKYIESNKKAKIVCSDCTARHARLEKQLRQPKSWKCRCPGTGLDRMHNPANIKCDLFPQKMGERRWPGKNNHVNEEDWAFVQRMFKRRKK